MNNQHSFVSFLFLLVFSLPVFCQNKVEKLATFELKDLEQEDLIGFVEDQYLVYNAKERKGLSYERVIKVVDIKTGNIKTNVPSGDDKESGDDLFKSYFVFGGRFYALYDNNEQTKVSVKRISGLDGNSASYSSAQVLLDYPEAKKGFASGLRLRISDNESKMAILLTDFNKKEKSNSIYMAVFDKEMQKLWEQKPKFVFEKRYEMRITNLSLSDAGNLFFVRRLDRNIPVVGLDKDVDVRMFMASDNEVGEVRIPFEKEETISSIQYLKNNGKLYALAHAYQELKKEPTHYYFKLFEIDQKDLKFKVKGKIPFAASTQEEFIKKYKPIYRKPEGKKIEAGREIPLRHFHFINLYENEEGVYVIMKFRDKDDYNTITSDLMVTKLSVDNMKMEWIRFFPSTNEFINKSVADDKAIKLFYIVEDNTLEFLHEDGLMATEKMDYNNQKYLNVIKIRMGDGESKIYNIDGQQEGEFKLGSVLLSKDESHVFFLHEVKNNTYTAYKTTIP